MISIIMIDIIILIDGDICVVNFNVGRLMCLILLNWEIKFRLIIMSKNVMIKLLIKFLYNVELWYLILLFIIDKKLKVVVICKFV